MIRLEIFKRSWSNLTFALVLSCLSLNLYGIVTSVPGSVPCYMALKEAENSTKDSMQLTLSYLEDLNSSKTFRNLNVPSKSSEFFFRSDKHGSRKYKIKQVASQLQSILEYSKQGEESKDRHLITEGFTIEGNKKILAYLEFMKKRSLELRDAKNNQGLFRDFVNEMTLIGIGGAVIMPWHPISTAVGAIPFVFAADSLLHQFFVRQDFSFVSKVSQVSDVLRHGEAGHLVYLSRKTRLPRLIKTIRDYTNVNDPMSESSVLQTVDFASNPSFTNKHMIDFFYIQDFNRRRLSREPFVYADWVLETRSKGNSLLHFVFRYSLPKEVK